MLFLYRLERAEAVYMKRIVSREQKKNNRKNSFKKRTINNIKIASVIIIINTLRLEYHSVGTLTMSIVLV